MISKTDVIGIYKRLFRTIKGIPKETQRNGYMKKLKKEFTTHRLETDPSKISNLYSVALDKLGFLAVISNYKDNKDAKQFYVSTTSGLVEGKAKLRRNGYRDTRIDPDDLERHKRLLRRQQFKDRHLPLRWGEDPN